MRVILTKSFKNLLINFKIERRFAEQAFNETRHKVHDSLVLHSIVSLIAPDRSIVQHEYHIGALPDNVYWIAPSQSHGGA